MELKQKEFINKKIRGNHKMEKKSLKSIIELFEGYDDESYGIADYMSKTEQLNNIPKGVKLIRKK